MDISEIYQHLGQNIVDAIEEDWKESELDIICNSSSSEFKGFYINSKDEKNILDVNKFDPLLGIHVINFYKTTNDSDNFKWNRAIFKINAAHSFDMDFKWDQELEDEMNNNI